MKKRRKATAAGDRRALALSVALASACSPEVEPTIEAEAEVETEAEVDPHAEARERLAAFEHARREAAEFATIPASDGRFGADPYQLIALPDGRVAGLLRGDDRVVLFDRGGAPTGSAATVHDPTDLAWRDGELWVVGTGEARIARYRVSDGLEPNGHIELAEAFAPRAIAVGPDAVFVADERGRLHVLRDDGPVLVVDRHCRGPLALELVDDRLLLANCLLDHRIRIDRLDGDALVELGAITHDGPIWSFASGPELDGERLLALTGVEDRPLDRSDGGFGYVDSFVFVYALGLDGDSLEITRRATINVSELGVVTPKWSRWLAVEQPAIELAGYATAELLRLRFVDGLAAAPIVERSAGLPGTTAVVELADRSLLAANPLLDGWLRLGPETSHPRDGMVLPTDAKRPAVAAGMAEIRFELLPVDDDRDDRSFAERLGEALVFTTAMAPQNSAEGQRSRFTCETCHFEGRGDGRTHFTGRERDGQRIHATSKPLLGLFPNRPYFSRALDRSMAVMVDNEFRVANHHSGRDPWSALTDAELPWLTALPGWPGEVDGEQLRQALMVFLQRFSTPSNPAVRGRERFSELERDGARVFEQQCEGCHRARLVSDDPSTQVAPGEHFAGWERLIFAPNGPIVWAGAEYAATEIRPYVHPDGARVPSLRRLYMKAPYFTNGSASDLVELLATIRRTDAGVTHGAGPIPAAEQLDPRDREALAAFLRLL